MPNWCENCIKLEGSTKTLINFVKKHIVDGEFDLRTIVPEPTSPNKLSSIYIINKDSHVEIPKDKPWFNWYNWRRDFWGIKWNCSDTMCPDIEEIEMNEYDCIYIHFSTPWNGFNQNVFRKMCKQHPRISFTYGWGEPGCETYGIFTNDGEYYGLENCEEELADLDIYAPVYEEDEEEIC